MPSYSLKTYENLSKDNVKPENLKTVYRLKLPFRLRIGNFYRIKLENPKNVELCFHNEIDIPFTSTGAELANALDVIHNEQIFALRNIDSGFWNIIQEHDRYKLLWTTALVVVDESGASEDEVTGIINGTPIYEQHLVAMQAVNTFIMAYANATKNSFGGTRLRTFQINEFYGALDMLFRLVAPANYILTDEQIKELFQEKASGSGMAIVGELKDISPDEIDQIPNSLKFQEKYLFYEFAFEARSHMARFDHRMGLLMMVVALEGVHAAYVRTVFEETISENIEIIFKAFQKQGFLEASKQAFQFMEESEQPSSELKNGYRTGIEIRNSIMHLPLSSDGGYKAHQYGKDEINKAFKDVEKVYEIYLNALNKRLGK